MEYYSSSNCDQLINGENLIHDLKLSSVVPASITAEQNRLYELTNMDLIMKLHYITTVHFFDRDAAEGMEIHDLKLPMFKWLEMYYPVCGRIRRSDGGGRPYVKCNDSGVRVVEAKCVKTIAEWREEIGYSQRLLVYSQPLGTDLEFTPLVFLQVTKFKCEGICVGMSWAHILGDAFSASSFINMWGNMFTENPQSQNLRDTPIITNHKSTHEIPILPSPTSRTLKQLNPLGDNWLISSSRKMQSHTFLVPESLLSKFDHDNKIVKPFELISALIWKSLAKIRGTDSEAKIVTVIKKGYYCNTGGNEVLGNRNQVIGIVEAPIVKVSEADPLELAKVIVENFVEENEVMEKENGNADFMVYGANLTFVDLEEVNLYGLRVKGREPVFANISIGGSGEEGVVFVLPSCQVYGSGRTVNVILPQDQLQELKSDLGLISTNPCTSN